MTIDISCSTVEQYLHEHIPISKQMAISVISINEDGVILSAPLIPNINHRCTVFGGSISAIAILSGWTLVHVNLRLLSITSRVVIQSSNVEYIKPIEKDFQAYCVTPLHQNWERFITTVSKKGKGRIMLNAEIYSDSLLAGRFQGEYVALKLRESV
jgi:thioesterase domain-containing protein